MIVCEVSSIYRKLRHPTPRGKKERKKEICRCPLSAHSTSDNDRLNPSQSHLPTPLNACRLEVLILEQRHTDIARRYQASSDSSACATWAIGRKPLRSLSFADPMLEAVLVLLDLRFKANLSISSREGSLASMLDQSVVSRTRCSGLT